MSKFIEVHNYDTNAKCLINVEHILRVERNIIRLVGFTIYVKESYDEIRALVLDAQHEQ